MTCLMAQGKIKQDTSALDNLQSVIEEDDGFMACKIISAFYKMGMKDLTELLGDVEWEKVLISQITPADKYAFDDYSANELRAKKTKEGIPFPQDDERGANFPDNFVPNWEL